MKECTNTYFTDKFYIDGDWELEINKFPHCKYLSADTETKLYYENKLVGENELYLLYKEKGEKWVKSNIEVRAYAFMLSDGTNTVIFQNIEDFLLACASFNVKKVFWYNAKFDFAIFDYYFLTNNWRYSDEVIKDKSNYGKLTDKTYQSLDGDFGQRYQMRIWKSYKNHNYKECVTSWKMIDICNIYGGGLAKNLVDWDIKDRNGKDIRKLEMNYDNATFENDYQYMINDTKGLHLLAEKIDKTIFDLCGLSLFKGDYLTAGGLAKKVMLADMFKQEKHYKNVEKFKTYFPITTEEDTEFRKHKLYKGGICLVNPYKINKTQQNVYKYDVNSMYPKQMRDMKYPVGRPKIYTNKIEYKEDKIYILKIKNILGVLKDNMIGVWQDTFTNKYVDIIQEPEYRYIWKEELDEMSHWYNLSYQVIEIYEYDAKYPKGIKTYIDRFYKIKCDTKGALKNGAKLFLNSAYGKLAQRIERTICRYMLQEQGYVSLVKLGVECDEKSMLSVVVGSRVTALARVMLLNYIREICPNVKRDFIYCDTDSVHALTEYKDTDNRELGKMKNEGIFEKAIYLAPKSYLMYNEISKNNNEYEVHCKGVNTKVVKKELDGLQFEKAIDIFKPNRLFRCLSGINVKGGKALIYIDKMIVNEDNIIEYLEKYKEIDELESFEIE